MYEIVCAHEWREIESVCMIVPVRERESYLCMLERKNNSMYICMCKRKCVHKCVRENVCVKKSMCICVRIKERK